MTSDLSFVWTPQFLVGTVIAGVLLNVVATYLVRLTDRIPASFRRARAEETARIKTLTAAATSDSALYAALAAEASRLRVHQLLRFLIAFVCVYAFVFLFVVGEMKPGMDLVGVLSIVFLVTMAGFQYVRGLDFGRRARRLDIALRAVQQNRQLPVMD